jgi:hypothetical protein
VYGVPNKSIMAYGRSADPHGVDHQRVAFKMAHRIPIQGRLHLRGMRLVHAYLAEFMILFVQKRDLVRLLQQLGPKFL